MPANINNIKKINSRLLIGHHLLTPESIKIVVEQFKAEVDMEVAKIEAKKKDVEALLKNLEETCSKITAKMNPSQSAVFMTQSKVFTNEFGDYDMILALPKKLSRLSSQCETVESEIDAFETYDEFKPNFEVNYLVINVKK